jgi:hypothetical protein
MKKENHTYVLEAQNIDRMAIEILNVCMSYKRFLYQLHSLHFNDEEARKDRIKIDELAATHTHVEQKPRNGV